MYISFDHNKMLSWYQLTYQSLLKLSSWPKKKIDEKCTKYEVLA